MNCQKCNYPCTEDEGKVCFDCREEYAEAYFEAKRAEEEAETNKWEAELNPDWVDEEEDS